MYKEVNAGEAVARIPDGATIAVGGAGAGHAVPDKLLEALGELYIQTGHPNKLNVIHPCGIGDNDSRGLNHIAHEGLVEMSIGGFWGNAPKMVESGCESKSEGLQPSPGSVKPSDAGNCLWKTRCALHMWDCIPLLIPGWKGQRSMRSHGGSG